MTNFVQEQISTDCDTRSLQNFLSLVKSTMMSIKEFNLKLTEFQEQQKRLTKELWTTVARYNTLDK